MFFYDVTSSQVANLNRTAVVLIPFGAVEQHSLHLPLGTDSIIGEAIARRLKQELSRQILVLPFTWLGSSRHHMGFPGSVTAEIETLIDVGVELGSSVAAHGFRNFILLNSHGGDINKVAVIAEKLRYRPNPVLKVVAVTYWHLIAKEIRDIRETPLGGMGHAGELETSAMLAVSPEHVRQDMMGADGQEKFSQFEGSDMFSPRTVAVVKPFKQLSRHGGIGDPRRAFREKGEIILPAIVAKLAEVVREIQTGNL